MSEPKIVAAAVRWNGVVYSLPAPARHHDVLRHIVETTGEPYHKHEDTDCQGFLDDAGRFLNRKQALAIAQNAGQMNHHPVWANQLFSENLW